MSHIQLDFTSFHLADATFVASNKKRICCSESKLSLQHILFLFIRDSLLTHKKSTTPGNLMSETVPASAPPGARTLHTLKALGHFISVYYALFCVIKMPAIPLFIGHCEQYKTLWYFIIKCKKFKCLWEGF